MNFLDLAKRIFSETGLGMPGSGPSAVAAQVGMNAKVVAWTLTAHQEIQEKHQNWNFDWAEVSQPLTASVDRYAPFTAWGLKVRSWDPRSGYIYSTAAERETRAHVAHLVYADFRRLQLGGETGTPLYWTELPDKRLAFYPSPDDGLTFEAECFLAPQVMVATTDVPRMPDDYHMAIVWRGVMLYCGQDENAALFAEAKTNYDRLIGRMEATELPDFEELEPMA